MLMGEKRRAGLTRGTVLLSKVTGMSGEQLWVPRARGSPSRRVRVANISWLSRGCSCSARLLLSSVPYIGLPARLDIPSTNVPLPGLFAQA